MEKLIFILLLAPPFSVVVFHFIKLKFNKKIIHEGYFTLPIIFHSISFITLLFNYGSLNKLEFSYIKIHSSLISLIFSLFSFLRTKLININTKLFTLYNILRYK